MCLYTVPCQKSCHSAILAEPFYTLPDKRVRHRIMANFTTRADSDLAYGWVVQPDGRGTIDILYNCLVTTFLCSWSALFLNIPAEYIGPLAFVAHKLRFMIFAIAFPEMLTGQPVNQSKIFLDLQSAGSRPRNSVNHSDPIRKRKRTSIG